ncbi:MAG TPA: nuclear transport factor 2 family protein [Acidimicrobiales bacterium]|nr:nuclear transport factor 2 family protein [Acidimicrobiales bacterium]
MAEHPNAQLIREGYAAFSRGDLAKLSELFTQDIQWHEAGGSTAPLAGDYKGQEAVFTMFGQLIQLTGGQFAVEVEEVIADDHQAAAIHTATARRGSTTYHSREALVFHILDGKVTDAWHTVPDIEAYDAFWAAPLDVSVTQQNIANARRGYEAFAAGNMDVLTELLADDCVWHVKGGGPLDGDYVGRDATFGFFLQSFQETDGTLRIDVHDILANEDHVTVLCTVSATRKGVSMSDSAVHVYHVKDGKTLECWQATTDPAKAVEFWK